MAHVSLYRKYRSQTFEDLVGQDHVVRTLQNALRSGRIAHAYLFTGPRGTGKTSSARLLAKCLSCQSFPGPTPTPCNRCEMCVAIADGTALDVAEFDAASEAGVEDVREKIVSVVQYPPMVGRFRVFIIDEVHDLSAKAFDALLKTIEEPPAHLVFVLATTEAHRVPPTIRSRCQKYEFHRASIQNLRDRLNHVIAAEGIAAEPAAINAIARMADGGYRDALTLLEQAILLRASEAEGEGDGESPITLKAVYDGLGLVSEEAVDALLDSIRGNDAAALARALDEIAAQGRDPRAIVESMLHRLTDLTRAGFGVAEGSDAAREASLHEAAARFGRENLLVLRSELATTHRAIRDVSLPRLWLEAELARIAAKLAVVPAASPAVPLPQPAESREAPRMAPFGRAAPPIPSPAAEPVGERSAEPQSPDPAPSETATPAAPDSLPKDPQGILDAVRAGLNPTIALNKRLDGARVLGFDAGVLRVELPLALNVGWFSENVQRRNFLRNELSARGLRADAIEFSAAPRQIEALAPESVELPLEGADLHRALSQRMVPRAMGDEPASDGR